MNSLWRIFDFRYIYILGNTRHLFRYKIGISNSMERRTKDINNSVRGEVYEIFAARFFFARKIENLMHIIYRPVGATMYGSGRTEWFWMLIPVTPTLLLIVIWVLQWILIPILLSVVYYLYHHWRNLF